MNSLVRLALKEGMKKERSLSTFRNISPIIFNSSFSSFDAQRSFHMTKPTQALRRSTPQLSPLGPLFKIVATILPVISTAIVRAIIDAYKDVATGAARHMSGSAGGIMARRKMGMEEAKNILGVDDIKNKEEVLARFEKLITINSPSDNFRGSPYVVKKITTAKSILLGESADTSKTENKEEKKDGQN